MLQNTYAASVAEAVNTYEKLGVLDTIVERERKAGANITYLNQRLGIQSVEDVFALFTKSMAVPTGR